jgi:hypothetical protein
MNSKILIIIIASFLSSIFGSKAQTQNTHQIEKFSIVEAKMKDGKPILGSINMAYKN